MTAFKRNVEQVRAHPRFLGTLKIVNIALVNSFVD